MPTEDITRSAITLINIYEKICNYLFVSTLKNQAY